VCSGREEGRDKYVAACVSRMTLSGPTSSLSGPSSALPPRSEQSANAIRAGALRVFASLLHPTLLPSPGAAAGSGTCVWLLQGRPAAVQTWGCRKVCVILRQHAWHKACVTLRQHACRTVHGGTPNHTLKSSHTALRSPEEGRRTCARVEWQGRLIRQGSP